MINLHKALEALTRLPQTEMRAVNELTAAVRAVAADALKTLREQDATIAELREEVDGLHERWRAVTLDLEYHVAKLAHSEAEVKRLEAIILNARRQLGAA